MQKSFHSPEAGVQALIEATKHNDTATMLQILGPEAQSIINTGDPGADQASRERFVQAYEASHTLVQSGDETVILQVGNDEWPFPIPLVKDDTSWRFDTEEGKEDLLNKTLTGQGSNALGGAYDYVVNGKMIGGFALVAYPAQYGSSGIMTFMVNHDGVVYQKDLGPDTTTIVQAMTQFDPDETWKKL
jgi:hypothetical protein